MAFSSKGFADIWAKFGLEKLSGFYVDRFIRLGSGNKEVERVRSILNVRTPKKDRKERKGKKKKKLAKESEILKSGPKSPYRACIASEQGILEQEDTVKQ